MRHECRREGLTLVTLESGCGNSVSTDDDEVVETCCVTVHNGDLLKVNDSHIGFSEGLPSQGGSGLSARPFGEGNSGHSAYISTAGESIYNDVRPREQSSTSVSS